MSKEECAAYIQQQLTDDGIQPMDSTMPHYVMSVLAAETMVYTLLFIHRTRYQWEQWYFSDEIES